MVYVGKNEYKYGRMIMSHMGSDNIDELHEMANKLGLKREWFQDKKHHPHYDISKGMKLKAIELGAVEVSDKQLIRSCYPVLKNFMDGKGFKI